MRLIKLLFFLGIASLLILGCRRPWERAQPPPQPPVLPANAGKIEAKLSYLEGEVSLIRDKARLPAELDMTLVQGDTVETGKDAQAEVTFDDSSEISLDPETRYGLTELVKDISSGQRTVKTDLMSGELKAKIAKLAKNSTFEIESPTAVSAVRGTEFIVAYKEGQPTQVTVLTGIVGVRRPGKKEAEVFIQEHERLLIRLAERPGRPFRLAPGDEDLIRAKWKRWQDRRTKLIERLRPGPPILGPGVPRGLGPGMGRGPMRPLLRRGALGPGLRQNRKPGLRPGSRLPGGALKRRGNRLPKGKNLLKKQPRGKKSRRSR